MHQRFTPYGTLLARDSAGSSMPKGLHVGWTGREYDAETGFSFHRARYYSADLRRWTQEDPIGYAGGGNLYAYVGGQVMEGRDPSGLMEDLSGRSMGDYVEAPRPNANYQLPSWPGGGGRRGGSCFVECWDMGDRMMQKQDEFFEKADDVVIIITYTDHSTRKVTADPKVADDVLHCYQTSVVCGAQLSAMEGLGRDFHYYFAEYGSLDVHGPSGRVANPGEVTSRPRVAGRTEIWLDPATARNGGISMNQVIVHENWHALTHDPLTGALPCDEICARTLTNSAGW
jgi:RHS repeat-associated protein